MNVTSRIFTPAEAAAVSGVGIKAVHNAIDKRIVDTVPAPQTKGTPKRRALTKDDLLRLKLWYGIGSTLAAEHRRRLFEAIKASPSAKMVKADDLLIIDVGEARRQLRARMEKLDEAEAAVERRRDVMGGEPVFKGTRIPVRLVAAMVAQGAEEPDLLDGYPKLTRRMVELASIWAAAHPARGRPKGLAAQGLKAKLSRRLPLRNEPVRSGGTT